MFDLDSRNGTRLGDDKVRFVRRLYEGDRLDVGAMRLRLEAASSHAPRESAPPTDDVSTPAGRADGRHRTPGCDVDRAAWWTALQIELLEKSIVTDHTREADAIFAKLSGAIDSYRADCSIVRSAFLPRLLVAAFGPTIRTRLDLLAPARGH